MSFAHPVPALRPQTIPIALASMLLCLTGARGQDLVISEFLAANGDGIRDPAGDTSDWIEIHNRGDEAADLAGYGLRDENTTWLFPDVTLEAGAYLIVFASGLDSAVPADPLHTSFSLSRDGETLALLDPNGDVVSSFDHVPPQREDVSYGLDAEGTTVFFTEPTPGETNGSGALGFVADTKFSVDRGHYEEPFELVITSETEGATIYYTTDGRDPSKATLLRPAKEYTEPILIDRTTILRAHARKNGYVSTNVDTQTYIFIKDVIRQPANPQGFPSSWGVFTGVNGGAGGRPVPADYEMNPDIVDENPTEVETALQALPVISIVMNPDDLFGTDGILQNPFGAVDGSGVHSMDPFVRDRQTSMEWIDSEGGPSMQIDCGIRLSGGWSRHYIATPKKSFSLLFKEAFGASKLNFPIFPGSSVDEFDRIILKAIFSNAWPDAARPPDYLRDHFMRQTRLDMGGPSSHGTWVHVYLNGLYWGIYNPTERPDASYAASHFGGEKEEYDALKHAGLPRPGSATTNQFEVIDGEATAWREALSLAQAGLGDDSDYEAFRRLVDVENLADYMILNMYASNVDWPHKNWYANRKREDGAGFRFFSWDAEYAWHDVSADLTGVNNPNTPAYLYARARENEAFRLLFADRIQKHLFGDGALRPEANSERYRRMAAVLEPAIIAEASRWGDNGHTRQGATNYTKAHWEQARDGILNNFFPNRHERALEYFVAAGLYLDLEAPIFGTHGGLVPRDFALNIRSRDAKSLLHPTGGEIFYTLDGTDPRGEDNDLTTSALLYSRPVNLTESVTVRARLRMPNLFSGGTWSALTEAQFLVGVQPANSDSLRISKIHYRPPAPSAQEIEAGFTSRNDFEYLEFLNVSDERISLAGLRLTEGVTFTFPFGSELDPGGRLLLVGNADAFAFRFGMDLPVGGVFDGNLSNGGERLVLQDGEGRILWAIDFGDEAPWPEEADGDGSALVFKGPGSGADPTDPAGWVAVAEEGKPGKEITFGPETNALQAWMEARGIADLTTEALLVFALGRDLQPNPTPELDVRSENGTVRVTHRKRTSSEGVAFQLQRTADLRSWENVGAELVDSQTHSDGTSTLTWLVRPEKRTSFLRLTVRVAP